MRDYGIQFNSDNSATFSGSIGRVNEINAVRLVITLNEEMADAAVDCYMLCFDTAAGLENPIKICRRSDIIDGSGSDYYEDGVIYFTVPGELTANKKLGMQVEAHVLDAMGEIERLIKSQVITLELDGSVEGDDSFSEAAADGIVLRIYDAIADANAAAAALNQAQLDGEFNGADATINGVNALTLEATNGITLTQVGSTATLSANLQGGSTTGGDGHSHENKVLLDSYTQTEVNLADAVTKKHTHENKSLLDDIYEITRSGKSMLMCGNYHLSNPPHYDYNSDTYNGFILPGVTKFRANPAVSLNISTTNSFNVDDPEYNFTFNSGATPTTLSFSTTVVWGGGNELLVEANKRYEISIRDNIALWTSVDWEEPSE